MKTEEIQLNHIKYMVVDVDGVMTDAGIYYDEHGNEWKKFSTRDAAGFFAAKQAGIQIIVLTGRECKATLRRMKELGVEHLYQNVTDKKEFLRNFMEVNEIHQKELAYIGDDLNDYASMKLSGFVSCPDDGCTEIREVADYISPVKGGNGVVRDVVEYILKKIGKWDRIISVIYKAGI